MNKRMGLQVILLAAVLVALVLGVDKSGAAVETQSDDDLISKELPAGAHSGAVDNRDETPSQAPVPIPLPTGRSSPPSEMVFPDSPSAALQIVNGDFEAGQGVGWGEHSSNGYCIICHISANATTHSGEWSVWLGGADDEHGILSQQVTVPADKPILSYYQKVDSEELECNSDWALFFIDHVKVSDFYLCKATGTNGWVYQTYDMTAYIGKSVYIEFVIQTSLTLQSSWSIDDVWFVADPNCRPLTRTHSGQGNNPAASPANSFGCATGYYKPGETITLTATPVVGWRVKNWSGTNNNASTSTSNTVTMPANDHTVSVVYEAICYSLSRSHTGSGSDPTASPANSTGCVTGGYTVGQSITLTAAPITGWRVKSWSGTNNDASTATTNTVTMPAANHVTGVNYEVIPPTCHTLTRNHTGQGSNPTANPAHSPGCASGKYIFGEVISLTATPANGWRVKNWSGTDDNGSTSTTNTVTMPNGNRTVSVAYENIPPTCYALIRSHTGSGSDPAASPANSTGCPAGKYVAGQLINLTATPNTDWRVKSWGGTTNDGSTATTNAVTMPVGDHAVSVAYEAIPATDYYLFAPAVLAPPPCFTGHEQPPNDNVTQANGPLCRGVTVTGQPNDLDDFFWFETTSAGPISVSADNLFGQGMQLVLYYQSVSGLVEAGSDTNQSDGLHVALPNAAQGRYYIRIFTETPSSSAAPYNLRAEFPAAP